MDQPSLGERLRQAREAIPASLHQAARETRIRVDHLEAMERGSLRFVSGRVYLRGMLRAYARWLGLDPDEIGEELDRGLAAREEPPLAEAFRTPSWRLDRRRRSPWMLGAGSAALILVSLWLVGLIKPTRVARPPAPPSPTTVASAEPVKPPSQPTEIAQASPPAPEGVRLVVSVIDARCWILVTADGQRVFERTLPAGESRTFVGSRQIKAVFGNLGAVRLELNGRDLGTPGAPGQSGSYTFDPTTTTLQG